ncbi:MAG: hypothetical protein KGI06_04035 [Candidatus Micrarchaeota archaeon]|nr:hypothetical protein [Candidatus Micrarchaeota archaeon]
MEKKKDALEALERRLSGSGITLSKSSGGESVHLSVVWTVTRKELEKLNGQDYLKRFEEALPEGETPAGEIQRRGKIDINLTVAYIKEGLYAIKLATKERSAMFSHVSKENKGLINDAKNISKMKELLDKMVKNSKLD